MARKSLASFVGLAGVTSDERPKAKRWANWFEAPMLLLAIWIIIEWYLDAKGTYPHHWGVITNWVVWLFFVLETGILCFLVRDKRRYLLSNWVNLLIIAVGLPLLWSHQPYAGALRSLRVLLLLGFVFEMSSTIRAVLSRNNLGLTLLVSLIIVIMAGTTIAGIDPAIDTPWDGIWWAWVTITTVGYGDIVPESPQGRLFGGVLMILGLGLFSLMTASFSAFLMTRQEEEFIKKEEVLIEKEEEVADQELQAIARLERIEARLEGLERGLTQLVDRLSDEPDEATRSDTDEPSRPE